MMNALNALNARRTTLNRRVMRDLSHVMGMPHWVDAVLDERTGTIGTRYLMLRVLVTLNKATIEQLGYQLHAHWRRRYRPALRAVRGRRLVPRYPHGRPWHALPKRTPPTAGSAATAGTAGAQT